MTTPNNGEGMGLTVGPVKLNNVKRMSEIIAIALAIAFAMLATAFYYHDAEAAKGHEQIQKELQQSRENMNETLKRLLDQQRLQTCILSLPQEQRQRAYENPNSLCHRLSRD